MRRNVDAVIFVLTIFIASGLYFAPTIIAQTRNIKHAAIIFSINLVFGWTVIAWVAVLIWAVRQRPASHGNAASSCPAQADVWIFDPPSVSEQNVIAQGDNWVFGPDHILESPRNH